MIRHSLFILAVLGSAATAIAAIAPGAPTAQFDANHMTVIAKNQAFPQFGPLVVEDCGAEDCSDVRS